MSEPATSGEGEIAPEPNHTREPTSAPVATPQSQGSDSPEWLPGRLSQARKAEREKFLKDIGVTNESELKERLAKLSELETQQLSEQERTQKLLDELTPKAQKLDQLQKTFASVVEQKFAGLTEQQQQAIDAKAAGDAEKRWEIMEIMESAGVLTVPAPALPKPASTKPAGAPPPPANPSHPQSPRAKWEELQKSNPTHAALFYQMNAAAINSSPS